MSRAPIGFADALTAAARLGITDPQGLREVTALLGLREATAPAPIQSPPTEPATGVTHWTPRENNEVSEPSPNPVRPRPATVVEVAPDPVPTPIDAPGPYLHVPLRDAAEIRYQPPLSPAHVRPAVTALLARPRPGGHPDLGALTRLIARCRPIRRVPFVLERSLSHGATIVADIGPAMLPYLADVDFFAEQIQKTVGRPRSPIFWRDQDDDDPIETAPDRPFVVISSLPRPHRAHWMKALRGDIVALVPHRNVRVGKIRMIAWDDLAEAGRGRA